MRILITGSRDWVDYEVIRNALFKETIGIAWTECTVVHGAARGADTLASYAAATLGMGVEDHPVNADDWEKYGKSAGHRRNATMVALGADVCLAFPLGESRGTRGCMYLAKRAGIPVKNYGDV